MHPAGTSRTNLVGFGVDARCVKCQAAHVAPLRPSPGINPASVKLSYGGSSISAGPLAEPVPSAPRRAAPDLGRRPPPRARAEPIPDRARLRGHVAGPNGGGQRQAAVPVVPGRRADGWGRGECGSCAIPKPWRSGPGRGTASTSPRCPSPGNPNRRHRSACPHPFEPRRPLKAHALGPIASL